MDAPTCRLCRAKHWSNEPHVLKTIEERKEREAEEQIRAQGLLPEGAKAKVTVPGGLKEAPTGGRERPRQPKSVEGTKVEITSTPAQPMPETTRTSELRNRPESRDKYNQRQREYMKKRRAELKAKP